MLKFLAVILAIVIVAGCTQSSQTPDQMQPSQTQPSQTKPSQTKTTNQTNLTVCNPPQIKSGTGCCMDTNGNGICDTVLNDNCWNVNCSNYCSGNTIYYKGRCYSGVCLYSSMVCSDACTNGRCVTFNPLYQNINFGINANTTAGSNVIFVEVTNIGIQNIDMTQMMAYLNGKYTNITGNTGILAPLASKALNITTKTSVCGSMIVIYMASGQSQSGTVYCFAKGFGQIQVMSPWSIAAVDGTMRLNILNREGSRIMVTTAKMKIGNVNYNYTASQTLAFGESAIITFVTSNWPVKIKPGSSYTAAVTVNYTYSGSALNSTGTLTGTYI